MMTTTTELDHAREETAAGIASCLRRLGAASRFLSLGQRLQLAEVARDLADELDNGRQVYQPHAKMRGRLIRTRFRDASGAPLYRIV
jgi:hypothetical protein